MELVTILSATATFLFVCLSVLSLLLTVEMRKRSEVQDKMSRLAALNESASIMYAEKEAESDNLRDKLASAQARIKDLEARIRAIASAVA